MIEQQGRVVRAEPGKAWVVIGPQGGCSACDAGRGCGAGLFGRLLKRQPLELELDNPQDLPVGQAVSLGIQESVFLRLTMALYALPILVGLAVAWVCHYISSMAGTGPGVTDLATLAGLIAGSAIALRLPLVRRPSDVMQDLVMLKGPASTAGCGKDCAS